MNSYFDYFIVINIPIYIIMLKACGYGGTNDAAYGEIFMLNSRWPISGKISWRHIRDKLYDPNNLIKEVESLTGIGRDKEYFESEKRNYLKIWYNRDRYLGHLERRLDNLRSASSKRDYYIHLDAMRNYALHLLDSWNKHSYQGELGSIEKIENYEAFKDKTYEICEELYRLITVPEYKPDFNRLKSSIAVIKRHSSALPETCESKIRQLDNPVELIIHCKRINLMHPNFDTVIGILDGGIEIPMAMRYIQKEKPNIAYLKYSGYSEGGHSKKLERVDEQVSAMELFGLDRKIRDADVAVVDDSIFTGRTFYRIIDALAGKKGESTTDVLPKPKKLIVSAVECVTHRDIGAQLGQIKDVFEVLDANKVDLVPPTFIREVRKADINKHLESIEAQQACA